MNVLIYRTAKALRLFIGAENEDYANIQRELLFAKAEIVLLLII
jgi:hypothetical protein